MTPTYDSESRSQRDGTGRRVGIVLRHIIRKYLPVQRDNGMSFVILDTVDASTTRF